MVLSGAGTVHTDDYSIKTAHGTAPCSFGSACTKGRWDVQSFDQSKQVRSIHSVLMYNGKVLLIAGTGNSANNDRMKVYKTSVYDPATGKLTTVKNTPYDLFCAGHVQLPDGRILVMGGTAKYGKFEGPGGAQTAGWSGSDKSWLFNPRTNKYEKSAGTMIDGHWYPSATELADGSIYTVGGYSKRYNNGGDGGGNIISTTAELYKWSKSGKGVWQKKLYQPDINWATYPALIQSKYKNYLFYSGASVFGAARTGNAKLNSAVPGILSAGFFDPTGARKGTAQGFIPIKGLSDADKRDQAASLLLPPAQDQRVMILGGKNFAQNETPATNHVDIVDLDAGTKAKYRRGPNLPAGIIDGELTVHNDVNSTAGDHKQTAGHGKTYVSAVILPNGKVFETGGSETKQANHVHEASTFDPSVSKSKEKWTPQAADPVNRTYHSMAMLLPDGRVLAAGSNQDAQDPLTTYEATTFDTRISLFTPPYMFKGGRPAVALTSKKSWAYGSSQTIKVDQKIKSASLIRPSAVTHSSDPNQRSVKLPVTALGGGKYKVKLDRRREITPPGWYMLYVNDTSGVPSAAKWVHVG
jgi:hypothetical protein